MLARYHDAAREHQAEVVVRITSDCPLIDPQVIDKVTQFHLDHHPKYDYVSNSLGRTYSREMDTEVFSNKALNEASAEAIAQPAGNMLPFLYIGSLTAIDLPTLLIQKTRVAIAGQWIRRRILSS